MTKIKTETHDSITKSRGSEQINKDVDGRVEDSPKDAPEVSLPDDSLVLVDSFQDVFGDDGGSHPRTAEHKSHQRHQLLEVVFNHFGKGCCRWSRGVAFAEAEFEQDEGGENGHEARHDAE